MVDTIGESAEETSDMVPHGLAPVLLGCLTMFLVCPLSDNVLGLSTV